MRKKLLLILLSLILILLPSCNVEDHVNDVDIPDDSKEKEEMSPYADLGISHEDLKKFAGFLEHFSEESFYCKFIMDTSEVEGNVEVAEAYVTPRESRNQHMVPGAVWNVEKRLTENLIMIDEKDVFEDAPDEYVYLLFAKTSCDWASGFTKVNSVVLENGIITVNIGYHIFSGVDAEKDFCFAIRIKKSSLAEEVTDYTVNFEMFPFDVGSPEWEAWREKWEK